MSQPGMQLTMGPVLFNWPAGQWRDFWLRIADEAPVDNVVLGEAVCAKRAPLVQPYEEEVIARLRAAGKNVAIASLAEVVNDADRRHQKALCRRTDVPVEVNDTSALAMLEGRQFHTGPLFNTYNEHTLAFLAARGALRVCLPVEMHAEGMARMAQAAAGLELAVEVFAWGRAPLALSARCYTARAHGRTKDTCQYVCERDPDGMDVHTLEGKPFLAVNGIQTMSHGCVNLVREVPRMRQMGIAALRLSPHTVDMVAVANIFADVIAERLSPDEADARLNELAPFMPPINGFYHHRPGHMLV